MKARYEKIKSIVVEHELKSRLNLMKSVLDMVIEKTCVIDEAEIEKTAAKIVLATHVS